MKWLADENFRNAIVRGLLRQAPAFDVVRAQDVPVISGRDDLALLSFATAEGRVVLLDECGIEADWAAGVIYVPIR